MAARTSAPSSHRYVIQRCMCMLCCVEYTRVALRAVLSVHEEFWSACEQGGVGRLVHCRLYKCMTLLKQQRNLQTQVAQRYRPSLSWRGVKPQRLERKSEAGTFPGHCCAIQKQLCDRRLLPQRSAALSSNACSVQSITFGDVVQVLVDVATRLRDMHAAGYVHRDVKPGNIMLLPRKNSWTVIDFGCTARTGEPAPLSFTVQYAPPEVIAAYLEKHKSIVATEAMDAWAMGVVAFELLTGTPAFAPLTPKEEVRPRLSPLLSLIHI